MYTELIFGASLKEDTPKKVIGILKYMVGDYTEEPKDYPFPEDSRHSWMLRSGSYYFGVNQGSSSLRYDEIKKSWVLNTRSNIKNYENEIESFLVWIKPWISQGSGCRDMYAIVIYEEQEEPELFYLDEL